RAADPLLPRAPQGLGRGRAQRSRRRAGRGAGAAPPGGDLMSLLVVGISHHSAGVDLLERVTVAPETTAEVLARLLAQPSVSEAVVLSTCNRVEVYAAVSAFHGGLAEIGAVLAERAGQPVSELAPHLYVHYGADAVRHALRVAAGLDSMVVGEAQILGQLRSA